MATNEILQFAETDTGTNLLTQAEYLADAQRPIGNQPGVARSKLVNKALRQSSLIAAAVAQFIADNQANNVVDTATPADIADWIEAAVRSIGIPTAVAGGTADAITADFTPNVALTNGTTVIVRAGAANTTTTPTFSPDGLTAKTIVKGNNLALAAGDIAGAGHWLEMNFDTVLDKWVLQNPAFGILSTGGKLLRITRYSTAGSGTWVKPSDTNRILVRAVGGGGGGGGGSSGSNAAGNGGYSGCYGEKFIDTPNASYAYVVGAAGSGGAANSAGSAGGQTSFGALTLGGGPGGGAGLASLVSLPTGSGWDRTSASAGGPGHADSTSNVHAAPGVGGAAPFSGGGSGSGAVTIPGSFGSGGGGGPRTNGTAYAGSAGGAGYIEIWEFA